MPTNHKYDALDDGGTGWCCCWIVIYESNPKNIQRNRFFIENLLWANPGRLDLYKNQTTERKTSINAFDEITQKNCSLIVLKSLLHPHMSSKISVSFFILFCIFMLSIRDMNSIKLRTGSISLKELKIVYGWCIK